jgi:hypothetical protein
MKLKLLDAIIRIRTELLMSNMCCKDFIPSAMFFRQFTLDKFYAVAVQFPHIVRQLMLRKHKTKGQRKKIG